MGPSLFTVHQASDTHTGYSDTRSTRSDSQVTYLTVLRKTCLQLHTNTQSHKNKNWDSCLTEMWHHQVQWPFLSVSSLRLLQLSLFCFLGAAPFSCLTAPSPPVLQPVFLLSLLTFLSFCVHLCSLSCSLPSALRQTLCRTQPETQSPLLFPGSLSLFVSMRLYLSEGHRQSPPLSLSLGVTISSPPRLSQELTLSHQNKMLLYIYTDTNVI